MPPYIYGTGYLPWAPLIFSVSQSLYAPMVSSMPSANSAAKSPCDHVSATFFSMPCRKKKHIRESSPQLTSLLPPITMQDSESSTIVVRSRLGHTHRLTRHQTSMNHKHHHNGVYLQHRALEPHAQRHSLVNPPGIYPVGHDGVETEGSGNRGALKVLGLPGGILGHIGGGDVEARETGQAAEDKESEAEVVERGADANGKGDYGRGETKGDLWKRGEQSR